VEPHVQRCSGAQGSSLSVSPLREVAALTGSELRMVEDACRVILSFFGRDSAEYVYALRGEQPGEVVYDTAIRFLRWYDETGILEVHGVFVTAPHAAP
jgi:hypothetical protein